jgi:CBS domain-containing protein
MEEPATTVMTDLARQRAITVRPEESLENAERLMISASVRLLLVVDRAGAIIGVLSYRDIVGQRATATAVREGVEHDALPISEIMTTLSEVEALDYAAVNKASVLELVRLMRERGRQHALVIETDAAGTVIVRGIFSITQIGQQLGVNIESGERVQSFSEIERLIAAA